VLGGLESETVLEDSPQKTVSKPQRVDIFKKVEACSPSFQEKLQDGTRKNIRPEYGFQEAREKYTGRTEWWREVSETSQS
jgi:hypothetical protein